MADDSFLAGGGDMGRHMRAHDWSACGLGPPASWPQTLRAIVRTMLNTGHPMYVFWGPHYLCLYNDAYSHSIGPERHPASLAQPGRAVWAEIWHIIGPQIEQVMGGGAATWHEDQLVPITRNGRREDVYWTHSHSPIDDENAPNGIGGVLVLCTETTARIRGEEALRDSQARLRALNASLELQVAERTRELGRLWKNSRDVLMVLDNDGRLLSVSPAVTDILGWTPEEMRERNVLDFVLPEDAAATRISLARASLGPLLTPTENRYRHQDGGHRWLSWVAAPEGELVFASGRHVTAEKEQAAAVATLQSSLLQSQKMESIGQLTGGVAHDFNNVLQIISGNLQLLHLGLAQNDAARKRLDTAAAAVARGAKLSAQLLAFARRQPLKPLATDLARLLEAMDELIRRAIGDAIATKIFIEPGLWPTLVDPHQLENVLLNLAINARDAMRGGGTLTVEVGNRVLDDSYAARNADVAAGDYVLLAVSDTGHGIPAALLEKIFEPFFTTKKEGEGTGLGLSMAYGFVKQSGGHIKVYSEAGHGTTFKLYLPRSHEAQADVPPVLAGPVLGGSETILVVEDDLPLQTTVVDLLKGLGYTVLKASDGAGALAVIQSGAPIDLLFTDVVMPGELRSPELARLAKAALPQLAVLFTSGYTQNAIVHGGRLDAGVELLSKPYLRQDLARKIRHLLANRDHAAALGGHRQQLSGQAAAAEILAAAAVIAGRNIVLVEDNDDARDLTAELLGMLGHTVSAVATAEQALPLLGASQADLLLTDITLPGMSGVELAAKAGRAFPGLQVVFSTGHAPAHAGDTVPGARVLLKPFSVEQLQAALLPR